MFHNVSGTRAVLEVGQNLDVWLWRRGVGPTGTAWAEAQGRTSIGQDQEIQSHDTENKVYGVEGMGPRRYDWRGWPESECVWQGAGA